MQISAESLLDGRSVTTFTDQKIVPWTVGVDSMNGLMTHAAVTSLNQNASGLPDDGVFAASDVHPEIVLHFSNAAGATEPQTHLLRAMDTLDLPVPVTTYSKLIVVLTSTAGATPVTLTLRYGDGSSSPVSFMLSDWVDALPAGPPTFFKLIDALRKWDAKGNINDLPIHGIAAVVLTPDANKPLASVQIAKTGGTNQYLTFWGATGVATGMLPTNGSGGAGGGGGATTGGAPASGGTSPAMAGSGGMGGVAGGGASNGGAAGSAGTGGAPSSVISASGGGAGGSAGSASNMYAPSNESSGCGVAASRGRADRTILFGFGLLLLSRIRRRRATRSGVLLESRANLPQ